MNALLEISDLNYEQVQSLFLLSQKLNLDTNLGNEPKTSELKRGRIAALVFFEASTRTRMSFESACVREGIYPQLLDGKSGSSLEKGESLLDTLLNIAAMEPDVMVIRCDDSLDLKEVQSQIPCPIVNAGWGKKGHPTQALLDILTLFKERKFSDLNEIKNEKLLIVGDILHSRVAASHFQLAKILGYQIAVCGPAHLLPQNSGLHVFETLEEGTAWASAVMALRMQKERYSENAKGDVWQKDISSRYRISVESLKYFSPHTYVMHPGPINHGVELDTDVLKDRRSLVLKQVQSGVEIRQAILHQILANLAGGRA